jgi:hypothetical protein
MVSVTQVLRKLSKSINIHHRRINISVVPRPVVDRARVRPSDLQDYRVSHRLLGPCCLCPMTDPNQPDFVEAAIYVVTAGPFSGQYVASCARDQCGYFGELWLDATYPC